MAPWFGWMFNRPRRYVRQPSPRRKVAWAAAEVVLVALVAIATLAILATAVAGCDTPVVGLRLAPSEQQKQSAMVARDLAVVGVYAGYPPGSEAALLLAQAAGPPAAYAGSPKEPINVGPAISAAAGSWQRLEQTVQAWKLKAIIQAKASAATAAMLADQAASIASKAAVPAAEIVYRTQAAADLTRIAQEVAGEIPIPELTARSPAEQALLDELKATVSTIAKAAGEQANRRPTVREVADKALDGASDAFDWADALLPGLGGLAGVGGIGALLRARKKSRLAAASEPLAADSSAVSAQIDALSKAVEAMTAQVATRSAAPPADPPATS